VEEEAPEQRQEIINRRIKTRDELEAGEQEGPLEGKG
jgi:hypothetical protein